MLRRPDLMPRSICSSKRCCARLTIGVRSLSFSGSLIAALILSLSVFNWVRIFFLSSSLRPLSAAAAFAPLMMVACCALSLLPSASSSAPMVRSWTMRA